MSSNRDRYTDLVLAAINAEDTALFSGTLWRDRRAMRISVVDRRTSDVDVDPTVKAVDRVLSQLR